MWLVVTIGMSRLTVNQEETGKPAPCGFVSRLSTQTPSLKSDDLSRLDQASPVILAGENPADSAP